MRPYSNDPRQQLYLEKVHAKMLRTEWQEANSGDRIGTADKRNPLQRARARVGVAFVELGRRLMPPERAPRAAALKSHADGGC
jgi:hypothetical protein